jgi:hypothetical protein
MRTSGFFPLWCSAVTFDRLLLAALALAAILWIGRENPNGYSHFGSHDLVASASGDRLCNPHDPFGSCAPAHKVGHPVGSGLSVILIEDWL